MSARRAFADPRRRRDRNGTAVASEMRGRALRSMSLIEWIRRLRAPSTKERDAPAHAIRGTTICPVLEETELLERNGATWVRGRCPFCWEHVAFRAPPEGSSTVVDCPSGHHPLRIVELRSAGRRRQVASAESAR